MYKLVVDDYEKLIEDIQCCSDKLSQHSYPVLRQHSRPCIDSIFGYNRRTVRILVSVRTDLTDEILVTTKGEFYTDCTRSYPEEHTLDDMVLLSGKIMLDKVIYLGDNIQDIILRTSIYPVGACVLNEQVYVYANIVIDHTLKDEEFFVTKDSHFTRIVDLVPLSPLEEDMVSKLVLVKGE